MKKVSTIVIDFLAEKGIKDVFMLPGGGCMHLVDDLGKNPNLNHHCFLHEQASAIAADAYAQYTNTPSALLVTTGPGGTNTLTGIAASWIDSTPLLVISGQAKTSDLIADKGVRQMGIQEVDIVSMVSPITKYATTITDPKKILYELEKAWHEATQGRRGPVWIDIPLDVQGDQVEVEQLHHFTTIPCNSSNQKVEIAREIIARLNSSKRPVMLIGHGIRAANCEAQMRQLIEQINIPTLLTWRMADFLEETHPNYCGLPGIVGQRGANFVQQNADLLIILGARLDLCQTGFNHPNFAKHAKKIIVDIDPHEINKLNMDFVLKISQCVKPIVEGLWGEKSNLKKSHSEWLRTCVNWKEEYPVVPQSYYKKQTKINTYVFVDILAKLMNSGDLFVPGSSGACAEITQQAFKSKSKQRIINSPGLGAMGFGLSAAIGACLASQGQRTVCVDGDGGIQLNIQELQTLKRLQLPIIIFILNNNGYVSISAMQKNRFDGNYVASNTESGLELPDICKIADAYGISNMRISTPNELEIGVQTALKTKCPLICDVIVDPDIPTSPKLSSEVLPNGKIVSKPMEDLWPFLDRQDYAQHILYE